MLFAEGHHFRNQNLNLIDLLIKVQALLEEEHKVLAIDSAKKMKVTVVDTTPVKNSIHAMIRTWKYKYASQLHYNAKVWEATLSFYSHGECVQKMFNYKFMV